MVEISFHIFILPYTLQKYWNSIHLTDILHTSPLWGLAEWLARIHFRESTSGALGTVPGQISPSQWERRRECWQSVGQTSALSLSLSLSLSFFHTDTDMKGRVGLSYAWMHQQMSCVQHTRAALMSHGPGIWLTMSRLCKPEGFPIDSLVKRPAPVSGLCAFLSWIENGF